MRRLKILTWNTDARYLYYLTQAPHDFYVLSKPGRPPGYTGCHGAIRWGRNVVDMPVSEVKHVEFDCIIFQDDPQFLEDQYLYLSESQRRLPRVYIEHDPPSGHPTDMRHPMDETEVLLVHVTAFNALMWDSGNVPVRIIEHGAIVPDNANYTGDIPKGLVVIDNLHMRGRQFGLDIFEAVRERIPLDLVGMVAKGFDGPAALSHAQFAAFTSSYRFIFNPVRYGSHELAVIEAMMIGLPIVGLATTELATVIENGVSGFVDTDINRLVSHMHVLLNDRDYARRLGEGARRRAMQRFSIGRFVADWNAALSEVTGYPMRRSNRITAAPLGLAQRSPE